MQSKSAVLSFVSTKNCFIGLPKGWTSKLSTDKVTVLEVQGENGSLFSTWSGGVTGVSSSSQSPGGDTAEINGLYAAKLGLLHQQQVLVSQVNQVPSCSRVAVEPLSVDDWEILALHASYVENNLLNQVRAVWTGQVFPVWINKKTCIYLKIGEMSPSCKCCLLDNSTEVVVAPKVRVGASRSTGSKDKTKVKTDLGDKLSSSAQNAQSDNNKAVRFAPLEQAGDFPKENTCSSNPRMPLMDNSETPGGSNKLPPENEQPAPVQQQGMFATVKSWFFSPYASTSGKFRLESLEGVDKEVHVQELLPADLYGGQTDLTLYLRVQPMCELSVVVAQEAVISSRIGLHASGSPQLAVAASGGEWPDLSPEAEERSPVDALLLRWSDQPTTVYISLSTLMLQLPDASSCCLDGYPPRSFLAMLIRCMSREEVGKKASESAARKTGIRFARGQPEAKGDTSEESPLDGTAGQARSVLVRVMVTDINDRCTPRGKGHQDVHCRAMNGHVLIHDLLRRQLGLEVTGQVKLQPIKSHCPSDIKSLSLHLLSDKPKGFDNDMMARAFKMWLSTVAKEQFPLVVTQGTLVKCLIKPDTYAEFLVTFASTAANNSEASPSAVLHPDVLERVSLSVVEQVTPGSLPSGVTHLPYWTLQQFDPEVPSVTLKQLGGNTEASEAAMQHLEIALGQRPLSRALHCKGGGVNHGGVLLCGPKGVGKTSLAGALCSAMAVAPNLAWTSVVSCRGLKGKRLESVRKILEKTFDEAAWRQPSVVVLDDLDHLAAAPSGPDQEMSPEAAYFTKVAEVLKSLLKAEEYNRSQIAVIATCRSALTLHSTLTSSRGHHFFQKVVELRPPNRADRQSMVTAILLHKAVVSPESRSDLDLDHIAVRTEGCVARDLDSLVDRAIHAHLRNNKVLPAPAADRRCELKLSGADFASALDGFLPAALRSVSLHRAGDTGWQDVGGLHPVRRTLVETLQWPAKYPELFSSCPLRLRSGLLLYGAPGTGKTLLASVVARECGLNFISIKGPELLSKYIGASEQAVRDTFARAQSAKPCILFFDEFDSLAPRRGHDSTGVTDRVVNQLLTQLDGVEGLQGVYLLAATSRPDLIDPALLRPGRLDKALHCPMPDKAERLEILQSLTRQVGLAADADLESTATSCDHFTGADLKALLYNAQLEAIHEATDGVATAARNKGVPSAAASEDATEGAAMATTPDAAQPPEAAAAGLDEEHNAVSSPAGEEAVVMERDRASERHEFVYLASVEEGATQPGPELEETLQQELHQLVLPPVDRTADSDAQRSSGGNVTIISQRHLVNAAANMNPSVSEAERRKYQIIYEQFVSSRGGSFSDQLQSVGQRATLA